MLPYGLIGNWSPGIGDPTVMGWLTVVAYFVAAWLCWRALRRHSGSRGLEAIRVTLAGLRALLKRGRPPPTEAESLARLAALWLFLAALMLFLGFNKQLDLQSAITEIGRILAHEQGWYEERGSVQTLFIGLVGVFGLLGLGALVLLVRGYVKRVRLALLGTVFVAVFVLIRASSFHHMDRLIGTEVVGLRMNWILELGGIVCVAVSAWKNAGLSVKSLAAGRARK